MNTAAVGQLENKPATFEGKVPNVGRCHVVTADRGAVDPVLASDVCRALPEGRHEPPPGEVSGQVFECVEMVHGQRLADAGEVLRGLTEGHVVDFGNHLQVTGCQQTLPDIGRQVRIRNLTTARRDRGRGPQVREPVMHL